MTQSRTPSGSTYPCLASVWPEQSGMCGRTVRTPGPLPVWACRPSGQSALRAESCHPYRRPFSDGERCRGCNTGPGWTAGRSSCPNPGGLRLGRPARKGFRASSRPTSHTCYTGGGQDRSCPTGQFGTAPLLRSEGLSGDPSRSSSGRSSLPLLGSPLSGTLRSTAVNSTSRLDGGDGTSSRTFRTDPSERVSGTCGNRPGNSTSTLRGRTRIPHRTPDRALAACPKPITVQLGKGCA